MVDDLVVRAALAEALRVPVPEPASSGDRAALPAGGVALTLSHLTKSFGEHSVLHGIDLHVPAGQLPTVIRQRGAGKSPLRRILAGLDTPTSGQVRFDGAPADDEAHVTRLMFQEPRLLPWARVLQNVEVGLGEGRQKIGAAQRALAKLAAVGLDSRAGDWPSVL